MSIEKQCEIRRAKDVVESPQLPLPSRAEFRDRVQALFMVWKPSAIAVQLAESIYADALRNVAQDLRAVAEPSIQAVADELSRQSDELYARSIKAVSLDAGRSQRQADADNTCCETRS